MIKLHYLRYFQAVAEEGHFGRAAARLSIAQPALSQQIQRLEAIVGYPLLRRRPRVELTEAGEVLLRVARRTLEEVEEGVEAARKAARGEIGVLTVGFAASVIVTELAGVIKGYRQRFPDVDLHLRELSSAEQLKAVSVGTIDIGLVRETESSDESILIQPILREAFVVSLPPQHRLARSRKLAPQQLADEPFVLFPRDVAPGLFYRVMSLCERSGFTPRVVQEAREWLTVLGLVEAGLGVSIVPASFTKLHWGGVEYRPLDTSMREQMTVSICMRRDGASAAARSFAALALETCR